MGSILLIATVVLALVLGLVNFYYSYQAKKMLEGKVRRDGNRIDDGIPPLVGCKGSGS